MSTREDPEVQGNGPTPSVTPPEPPEGWVLVVDKDGTPVVDSDGAYLIDRVRT